MCIKGFMVHSYCILARQAAPHEKIKWLSLATMNVLLILLLGKVLATHLVLYGVIQLLVDRYNC